MVTLTYFPIMVIPKLFISAHFLSFQRFGNSFGFATAYLIHFNLAAAQIEAIFAILLMYVLSICTRTVFYLCHIKPRFRYCKYKVYDAVVHHKIKKIKSRFFSHMEVFCFILHSLGKYHIVVILLFFPCLRLIS